MVITAQALVVVCHCPEAPVESLGQRRRLGCPIVPGVSRVEAVVKVLHESVELGAEGADRLGEISRYVQVALPFAPFGATILEPNLEIKRIFPIA